MQDYSVFEKVRELIEKKTDAETDAEIEMDGITLLELTSSCWRTLLVLICQVMDVRLQSVFDHLDAKTSDTEDKFGRIQKYC